MPSSRWPGLDLRHLATLQAIAREGSFKAAAHALGYTPSAVSQQVASLERIVGTQVIAREQGRQALGLTEAGRILLRHLQPIEAHLAAAQADLDALADGSAGTLRVGAFESVMTRLLPDIVGALGKRLPGIRVDVLETLHDPEHLGLVERGDLDVSFTLLPVPEGPFETRVVMRDPWVLVVQAGSELARRAPGSVGLEAIAELPLVSFRAPRALGAMPQTFREAGIDPKVVARSDYNDAVQELAASGRGVALVPRLCVNARDERIEMVALAPVFPPREIALAWHRDRASSEAVSLFVELAGEVGARLGVTSAHPPRVLPLRPHATRAVPGAAVRPGASAVVDLGRHSETGRSRSPQEAPERTSDG
jgi:molybdate transport repressor ModE-like protein